MSKPRQITITRLVTVEVMVAVPTSDATALSKEACVFALAGGVEIGVMPPWIEVQSEERTLEPGVVLDAELLPVAEPLSGESTFLVGDRVMVVPDDAWTLGRRPPSSVRPSKREAGLGQAEKGYFSIDEAAAFVSCSTSHIRRQVTGGHASGLEYRNERRSGLPDLP